MRHRFLVYLLPVLFLSASVCFAQSQSSSTPPQTTPPRLDIYGFVMADFIYDLRKNDPDWFDVNRPTKLPAFNDEFGHDSRTWVGARQSQFGVRGTEPTQWGDLKTRFEFDLFGVGVDAGQTTIRPRHMYGELGAFGAGQTNSPFMDGDVFPNILEYWGPNGMVFFRNVQFRWMPLRGDQELILALERPGASQDTGLLASRPFERIEFQNVQPRFPMPDYSGHYRQTWKRGYIQGAGIVRVIKLDDQVRDAFNFDDSLVGWGVSISSNVKFGRDVLRLQYVFGNGIENYMNDAPVDVAAEPNRENRFSPVDGEVLPMRSLVAYLDHSWTDKTTTAVGYSELVIDNTVLQRPDAFHRGQYASINLLHKPQENFLYGAELQWGRRTNFGDGFHSNDYRLQVSFKYNFSAQIGGVK